MNTNYTNYTNCQLISKAKPICLIRVIRGEKTNKPVNPSGKSNE